MDREYLCKRCGRCCELKISFDGKTGYRSGVYCPFLVKEKNGLTKCTIYDGRKLIGCLMADEAARRALLPTDCPYVEGIENYEPVINEYMEAK